MEDLKKLNLTNRTGIKGNVRVITITDNVPEHWDAIIEIGKSSYDFWAYIFHDHDKDVDKHLHILLMDKGGTTLKRHCERFSSVIPSNFVEKVRSPRAMARYLVHKDQPEKFQYDYKLVQTNQPDKFMGYLVDHSFDIVSEYKDFQSLMYGQISIFDYLEKYRGEFSTMPFYQKQSFFHKLFTTSAICSQAGLSKSPPHDD